MKVALICSKSISKNALGGGLEQYLPDETSHIVTAACSGLSVPVYEYCKSRFLPLTSLYAGADRDPPSSAALRRPCSTAQTCSPPLHPTAPCRVFF